MNRSESSVRTKDRSRGRWLSIILAIVFALVLFFAPNLIRLAFGDTVITATKIGRLMIDNVDG